MMAKSLMRLGCGDAAALKLLRLISCCGGCCNTCKRRAVKQRHREAAIGWMLRKLGSTPQCPGGSAEHSYAVPASSKHRRGGLDKNVVRLRMHFAMALTALAHRSDTSRRNFTNHEVSNRLNKVRHPI